jgi:putative intracellular protease/amidase
VVIIPGGNTTAVLDNKTLVWIIQKANEAGATFGAICAGPLLLARAGLLKGRRFTHGYGPNASSPYWRDGTFVDKPVVVDGNIITAKADAYIDFAIEVLYAAGLHESWVVESLRNSGKFTNDSPESEIEV